MLPLALQPVESKTLLNHAVQEQSVMCTGCPLLSSCALRLFARLHLPASLGRSESRICLIHKVQLQCQHTEHHHHHHQHHRHLSSEPSSSSSSSSSSISRLLATLSRGLRRTGAAMPRSSLECSISGHELILVGTPAIWPSMGSMSRYLPPGCPTSYPSRLQAGSLGLVSLRPCQLALPPFFKHSIHRCPMQAHISHQPLPIGKGSARTEQSPQSTIHKPLHHGRPGGQTLQQPQPLCWGPMQACSSTLTSMLA